MRQTCFAVLATTVTAVVSTLALHGQQELPSDRNLTWLQAVARLDTDDADQYAATWRLLHQQTEWIPQAVRQLREWLALPDLTTEQQRLLRLTLAAYGDDAGVEQLVAKVLTDSQAPPALRQRLLQVLAMLTEEPLSRGWRVAVGQLVTDGNPIIRREALCTVKAHDLMDCLPEIRKLSQQTQQPLDLRIAALDCLTPHERRLSADAFQLLCDQLAGQAGPLTSFTAARALGAARLNDEQRLQLARYVKTAGPLDGLSLLPAFAKMDDPMVAAALLDALADCPTKTVLTVGDLDRLLKDQPTATRTAAQALRTQLLAHHETQRAHLAAVGKELPPGDAAHGKEVFFSPKASCAGCHRVANRGGGVGPNLSRIGFVRGFEEILESIVYPSAYVAPEFRSYVALSTDGRVVTGLWARETADAVILRMAWRAENSLPRAEVEAFALAKTSLMPDGLEKVLSRQELSDLVEFLANLR